MTAASFIFIALSALAKPSFAYGPSEHLSSTEVFVDPVPVQAPHSGLGLLDKWKEKKAPPLQSGTLVCAPGFVMMNRKCHKMTIDPGKWICEHGGALKKTGDHNICEVFVPQSFECRSGYEPDGPAGYKCISRSSVPPVVTCPAGFHIEDGAAGNGAGGFKLAQGFAGMKCVKFTPVALVEQCAEHEVAEGKNCVSYRSIPPMEQCPADSEAYKGPHGELKCKKSVEYECVHGDPHSTPNKFGKKKWRHLYGESYAEYQQGNKKKHVKDKTMVMPVHPPPVRVATCIKDIMVQSRFICADGSATQMATEQMTVVSSAGSAGGFSEHAHIPSTKRKGLGKKNSAPPVTGVQLTKLAPNLVCKEKMTKQPKHVCPVVSHPTMGCVRIATAAGDVRCPTALPHMHPPGSNAHPHHSSLSGVEVAASASASLQLGPMFSENIVSEMNYVPVEGNDEQIYVAAGGVLDHHPYTPGGYAGHGAFAASDASRGYVPHHGYGAHGHGASYRLLGVIGEPDDSDQCEDGEGGEGCHTTTQMLTMPKDAIDWNSYFTNDGYNVEHPGTPLENSRRLVVDPLHGEEALMNMVMSRMEEMDRGSRASVDLYYGDQSQHNSMDCKIESIEDAIPTCPEDMEPIGAGVGGKCYKTYPARLTCAKGWKALTDNSGCGLDLVIEPTLMVQPLPPKKQKEKKKHHSHHQRFPY